MHCAQSGLAQVQYTSSVLVKLFSTGPLSKSTGWDGVFILLMSKQRARPLSALTGKPKRADAVPQRRARYGHNMALVRWKNSGTLGR